MKKGGLFSEFKTFIMRGNVLDMAIGVVMATAFGAITTAIVDKILMPVIGMIIGGIDLSKLNVTLVEAQGDKAAVVIGIGELLVAIINFLIIALVVFAIVKAINKAKEIADAKLKKEEEIEEAAAPTTDELLAQILDELKKQNK